MAAERGWRVAAVVALYSLSGAASLMDQVVWLRFLSLTFGNTTLAAATLLAVFMGGLGLGGLLFGRLADRLRRPLSVFAGVQLSVALFALASPVFFGWMDDAYVLLYRSLGSEPAVFAAARAVLAAVLLLPPTLLMGGTLPLVLRAVAGEGAAAGRRTAVLYASNTLGAVGGVALAGFVTIRLVGLGATLLLAAGFDLLAGLGCLLIARAASGSRALAAGTRASEAPGGAMADGAAGAGPPPALSRGRLLAVFFAMGATSLALEVLWTRVLVFYLGSSVYAFSLMLALFLVGVGVGSLAAAPWVDRLRSPLAALAWLEAALAVWGVVQVVLFQNLSGLLGVATEFARPEGFFGIVGTQALALAPVLGPPTLLMGVSFPLAVKALNRSLPRLGLDAGTVYGSNTLGAVAGSLAGGFLLIPFFGTQTSLLVVAAANGALAGVLAWAAGPGVPRALRWAAAALPMAALASTAVLPPDRVVLGAGIFRSTAPEDLVHFHEDVSASVTIRRLPWRAGHTYLSLELNGVNVAGTSPELFAVQKMQGHLPMLLADRPREVVHIGFGSGGTAHAVSLYPVEEILVVELSPAVLAASDRYFGAINHGVLEDSRTKVELNDGRNFLLATPRRFDAVLSDSIHPRYSGNGSLYSLEYFRLLRERLRPGGAVSMWLPTYSLTPRNYKMVVKAFAEVFPGTAVWYEPSALNAFTIVTARADGGPWQAEALERAFADPRIRAELEEIGVHGPAEILACYMIGGERLREWLDKVPPHDDDLPAVEYESGTLTHRELTWLLTFQELLALRGDEPPADYLELLSSEERERARRIFDEHTAAMKRHEEFLAGKLREQLGLAHRAEGAKAGAGR